MKLKYIHIYLIILIVSFTACENLNEDFNLQTLTNPIKVGVVGDVTIGREIAENIFFGIKMAADEINAAGGLSIKNEERKIELIFKNSGGSPELGQAVVNELIAEGVEIIIGPTVSAVAMDMAQACIEKNILMMTYSATTPGLTHLVDQNLIWRTCPSDAFSGTIIAQYAIDSLFQQRAAILYRDDKFGRAMKEVITREFTSLGGEIVATAGFPIHETNLNIFDFRPALNELLNTDPQLIFAPVFELEIGKITQDLWASALYQNSAVKPKLFLTEGGFARELMANGQPDIVQNIFGISSSNTMNPNYILFKNNYTQKYHFEPLNYAEHAYDALYSIAYAMVRAQSTAAGEVKLNLRQVTNGLGLNNNPMEININEFEKAKDFLLSGKEINYEGASGPINFDLNGDPSSQFVIWKIVDGTYTEISYIQKE